MKVKVLQHGKKYYRDQRVRCPECKSEDLLVAYRNQLLCRVCDCSFLVGEELVDDDVEEVESPLGRPSWVQRVWNFLERPIFISRG